jgi:outer membrane protein assembly factor BamB
MLEKPEFEKNDFLWRVSTTVAVVSGIFSVIVFILIGINYIQLRKSDPIDDPKITEMRIAFADAAERDQVLADQIQYLDLMRRKAFFTSQKHLQIGAVMLLVGVSIFLISFKSTARWRPGVPDLAEVPTPEREFLAYAESRQLLTWAGVLLLGGGMTLAVMTESLIVPGALLAAEEQPIEEAPKVARAIPDWDEVNLNWPSFRGPGSYGVAHYTNAPTAWDVEKGEGVRWKAEVPISAANSPVVWGNRVFLSGADKTVREVYCYDTETGDLVWKQALEPFPNTPAEPPRVSSDTGHSASTMAVHGEQVFAIFANGDIVSYDFDGNQVWGFNIGFGSHTYGYCSSLVAYENLLYVQLDHNDEAWVAALDVATGDEAWNTDRHGVSWASPILAHTPVGPQLILNNEENVSAYNPKTGALLWTQDCLGGEVAPSPAYSDGVVFVAQDFITASAIKLSGTAEAVESEIVWEADDFLPDISSPVGGGGHFYIATTVGEIVSLNADTGEEDWFMEFEDGFNSSPVLVGDRIYAADIEGNMHIVAATAESNLIASIPMGDPVFATPAFMDGRIYVRTEKYLYCIEQSNA